MLSNAIHHRLSHIYLLLISFLLALSLSIPPIQSPDEADHIKRAYLVTEGYVALAAPPGSNSGGNVDSGLLDYLNLFTGLRFKPEKTLTRDDYLNSKSVSWAHTQQFSETPGTGFYFPAIYAPQATALAIGQAFDLSVDTSYRLARLLNIFVGLIILFVAFRITTPPPLIIALLILPMSLFQFMSASIDGVSNALTILAISLFISILEKQQRPSVKDLAFITATLLIICTSRAQLLPLMALSLIIAVNRRSPQALLAFSVSSVLALAWTYFAITHNVDNRSPRDLSTAQIASNYIREPLSYWHLLVHTISTEEYYSFYAKSFLGILGHLDTALSEKTYKLLAVFLIASALLSVAWRKQERQIAVSVYLFALAGLTVMLIFFALAISWTPYPTELIYGVQGRYFTASVMLMAYGLAPKGFQWRSRQGAAAIILLATLFIFSVYKTNESLLIRFYMQNATIEQYRVAPSPQLSPQSPLRIYPVDTKSSSSSALKTVSIQFATYTKSLSGEAKVTFFDHDQLIRTDSLDLAKIKDNAYLTFELPDAPISEIRISSDVDLELSTWQVAPINGDMPRTCAIYKLQSGLSWKTPGCQ
ncbi:DUF2142 domain-containing protein [Pseudomonas nitroreducens]|uniref:DUF2142 domain-containing protein n=1 Tax=Pseudomonas nitroreducens TaxID=46680 RepID=UPI0028AAC838|nr:DUF2142 domain-containing protein [Pseudomonas nitroreducens]